MFKLLLFVALYATLFMVKSTEGQMSELNKPPSIELSKNDLESCAKKPFDSIAGRMNKRVSSANAKKATKGQFPWMVSLVIKGKSYCTGFLVSSEWVIVPTHCFRDFKPKDLISKQIKNLVTGYVGTTNKKGFGGKRILFSRLHTRSFEAALAKQKLNLKRTGLKKPEDWEVEANHFMYNIAALKIDSSTPVTFTEFVRPLCLPRTSQNYETMASDNVECYLAGWGELSRGQNNDNLHYISLKKTQKYQEKYCQYNRIPKFVAKHGFCFGGDQANHSGSKGDGGSPLVCRDKQTGNSWAGGMLISGMPGESSDKILTIFVNPVANLDWLLSPRMFEKSQPDEMRFAPLPDLSQNGWVWQPNEGFWKSTA